MTHGLVWLAMFVAGSTSIVQQPARSDAVACVKCLVLHVPDAAASALAELPAGALDGLTVVVDAADATADLMRRIQSTGAIPGVVLPAADATRLPPVVTTAAVVVLTDVNASDDTIFSVRTIATMVRSVAPSVRILVAAPEIPERLAGYVDGSLEPGPRIASVTVETLADVSLKGGSDPLLVRLDEVHPQVLLALAAQRAIASEVRAAPALTVDEIIARHQAQRRRQNEVVQWTIAHGTTALMFEVPGFVAPVTITAATEIYARPGLTELEQRDIRVNGAAIAGGNATAAPQLPLIEPERVATPPLTITLNETYRYSLVSEAPIDGGSAYVIEFAGPDASGRAWIDRTSFALRRIETVQRRLQGAIVSSEQHEQLEAFAVGDETVWLPVHTRVFQMYEGAGHRTPIHREIATPSYEINPADFDARRAAAHASPHLMLRETPSGFRYLLRDPDERAETARTIAPRAGERIRAAVVGLLLDPNISMPLPFAGLSYVDLNLFDTGAQLNAFFGGSYGQLSWSVPSVGGTRWQAHGRMFAIAAKYNDRAFRGGRERYGENITQRPAHVSAGVLRPVTSRARVRLGYELDYTAFDRSDTTDAQFVVPPDALVHGLVAAVETEWGPWNARAWWNPARRQRWAAWGDTVRAEEDARNGNERPLVSDVVADDARTFQRFGAAVARTLALGSALTSRVEVAWMEGSDLDRFSRYSFNALDNRLHGYPTASIRYDRGAVMRSASSWSVRGGRIDGFVDLAVVRDPGFGDALRGYPGIGAAIETAGPLRTLWSVEWGYGFKARREDGGTGTHAIRITGFRTF